jgi:hypothetical protein
MAAGLTAHGTTPDACHWRAMCAPARPELIAGWASAERLRENHEADVCGDVGIAVHALHVSTRYARSGLLIKYHDPVFDVLLLEEIDATKHVFRRLGVGRIFDIDLIREFQGAEARDIQLV